MLSPPATVSLSGAARSPARPNTRRRSSSPAPPPPPTPSSWTWRQGPTLHPLQEVRTPYNMLGEFQHILLVITKYI